MATVNPYTIETNIEIIPPKTEAKPLTVHAKATAEEEFLQIFSNPCGRFGPTTKPLIKDNTITKTILII